jgi:hypothetical protein
MFLTYSGFRIANLSLGGKSAGIAAGIAAPLAAIVTAFTDPTVKVAIIAGIAMVTGSLVAAVTSVVIQILNYRLGIKQIELQMTLHTGQQELQVDAKEIVKKTDGILTKLYDKNVAQGAELDLTKGKLSHAEGRREGLEVAEEKAEGK